MFTITCIFLLLAALAIIRPLGIENASPFPRLREEFTRLKTEATAIIETAAAENRELKDEEKTENEKRFSRLTQIKETLENYAKYAALAITGDNPGKGKVEETEDAPGRDEFEQAQARDLFAAREGETAEAALKRHRDAVNHFIRTGRSNKFTITTASGSGVLLPTSVGTPIVIKRMQNVIRAALISRGLNVITTAGMENLSVPVFDDSANTSDVIAENNTSENNKDPAVTGSLALGATLYDSGTVWSSNTLLNSLTYDLLAYLEPMLAARIATAEITAWFIYLAANATVGKTGATQTGITYTEALAWQHSVPLQYRADGVFFVSDGLYQALRGLLDSTGQPIYQMSMRDDAPDTLLGWPIFPTTGLAAPAAGVVSGIAASASALVVRDVNNRRIARYTNIPTHPDQFGIRMFSNGDFKFVSSAVRAFKQAP